MPGKGAATREKILDTAQALILDRGFSGVSVDNVIERLQMTKGAFFYHFKNKNELAMELIDRYIRMDVGYFHDCLQRADKLSNDPLQQVLIVVGLYEEMFAGLEDPYPGCLLASYIYELQMFGDDIKEKINQVFLSWRTELSRRFEIVRQKYPPTDDVHLPSLADEFLVIIEGAFILSKSLNDPKIVVDQLQHYKKYLEMTFRQQG
jgi:TetR/AcrR family transcriptional repressor of nem operon